MAGIKRRLLEAEERRRPGPALGQWAAAGVGLACLCHRCGHEAAFDPATLLAWFGPQLPVAEIGLYLRCPGCGTRDVATCPAEGIPSAAPPPAPPATAPVLRAGARPLP